MAMRKCPNCGRNVNSESRICIFCDYNFKKGRVIIRNTSIGNTNVDNNKVKSKNKKSIGASNIKKIAAISIIVVLLLICFNVPYINNYLPNPTYKSPVIDGTQVTVKNPYLVKEKVFETHNDGTSSYTDYYLIMTVDITPNYKTVSAKLKFYDENDKFINQETSTFDFDTRSHFDMPENTKKVNVEIYSGDKLLEEFDVTKYVENETHVDKREEDNKITAETSSSSSSSSSSTSSSSSKSESSSSTDYSSVFVKNVLEIYDLDGDGGLSPSEWDYWCSREGYAPMSACDLNGDGFCSKSELSTYSHDFGY